QPATHRSHTSGKRERVQLVKEKVGATDLRHHVLTRCAPAHTLLVPTSRHDPGPLRLRPFFMGNRAARSSAAFAVDPTQDDRAHTVVMTAGAPSAASKEQ